MSNLEGVILSDYLLLQCISKGGMADVYRARHQGEKKYEVAVKIFHYAGQKALRDYFMIRAEKIGQFDHPHILPLLEYGEGEDMLYTVTPYVSSGTLNDLLRLAGERLTVMQALPVMQQLCSAVQYAHDRDVIHGNIKPSNIFVTVDGRVLLSDFSTMPGFSDSQDSLIRMGWGTAEYASPEQSLGVLRRASDIYSLGALLFRILTGSPPFMGQTPVEVLLKHVRHLPPSTRGLAPHISDAVDGVLRMAMQKRPDDRFASAKEMSDALLAAVTIAPMASPPREAVTSTASPSTINPDPPAAPIPSVMADDAASDPQTPLPASIAFGLPLTTPVEQVKREAQVSTGAKTMQGGTVSQGAEDKTFVSRLLSGEPPEWSPLMQPATEGHAHDVPFNVNQSLFSKPHGEAASERNILQGSSVNAVQSIHENNQLTFAQRFRKWLPAIVILLLLIGLLGALLSSFFFPENAPGTGTTSFRNSYSHVSLTIGIPEFHVPVPTTLCEQCTVASAERVYVRAGGDAGLCTANRV